MLIRTARKMCELQRPSCFGGLCLGNAPEVSQACVKVTQLANHPLYVVSQSSVVLDMAT